jgi:hypothetical protein
VVCVGDIPNYLHATVFTGCFHRIYNLEWARYFTNNCGSPCMDGCRNACLFQVVMVCMVCCRSTVYKSMISRSDLPLSVKQDALRDDFNLDGLPQVISEVNVVFCE